MTWLASASTFLVQNRLRPPLGLILEQLPVHCGPEGLPWDRSLSSPPVLHSDRLQAGNAHATIASVEYALSAALHRYG